MYNNVLEIMKQNKTICPNKSMLEMMVNIRSETDRYSYYTLTDIREGTTYAIADEERLGGVFVVDYSKPQAFFSVDIWSFRSDLKDELQKRLDRLNDVLVCGQCHFEGINICYQIKVDWLENASDEHLKLLAKDLVDGYDRDNNLLLYFIEDVRELSRNLQLRSGNHE